MMPDWLQQTTDVVGGASKYVAGGLGISAIKQGISNYKTTGNIFKGTTGGNAWQNFWGKSASTAAGSADDVVSGAASAADDVVIDLVEGADGVWRQAGSAASNSADDVLGLTDDIIGSTDDVAKSVLNSSDDLIGSVDDIMSATAGSMDDVTSALAGSADDILGASDDVLKGVSGLSKVAKGLGIAGTVLQAGVGVYNYTQADSTEEKAEVVGETAGSMAGGWAGASAGAAAGSAIGSVVPGAGTVIGGLIGGVVGAVGGSLGGDWLGGKLGSSIGQDLSDAETNYGTKWAGLPIIGGLWRKDGTIAQQKANGTYDWSKEEVTDINTGETSTVAEIEKHNAEVRAQWSADNADDIEAFKSQLLASVQEDGSVDLSFLNGTDMSTVGMLMDSTFGHNKLSGLQYLLGSGQTLSDIDFGTAEEENYEKQIEALMESMDSNSSAVDNLTTILQNAETEENSSSKEEESASKSVWYKPWTWFSHATGNDYVPYDNYTALLHKGEMVLTSSEADDYRQGKVGNGNGTSHATGIDININLNGSVDGMTPDNQDRIIQAIVAQISASDLQDMISNGFVRTQNY